MHVKFLGLHPWHPPLVPHNIPGGKGLALSKKNCCFIPRVRIETYCAHKKTWVGKRAFVWGGREGRTEVELDREGWEGDHVTKYLPVHHPLEEPQAELLRFKVSYHVNPLTSHFPVLVFTVARVWARRGRS
jgi:hypothetical protein